MNIVIRNLLVCKQAEDILSAEQFLASQILCSMELNGKEGDILFYIFPSHLCIRTYLIECSYHMLS